MKGIWRELDDLIDEFWRYGEEIAVKVDVASECCWGGELRWTEKPNAVGLDRSVVLFAAAGNDPEEIVRRLIDGIRQEAGR